MSNTKYLNLLGNRRSLESVTYAEKAIVNAPAELSNDLAKNLLEQTNKHLNIILERMGGDSNHKQLIEETILQGREGLTIVGNRGAEAELTSEQEGALEAIVIATGARPAVKYDEFLTETASSLGEWDGSFNDFRNQILSVGKSVGRIDRQGKHYGTGFVVGDGLIMTNRHVLKQIAKEDDLGNWSFHDDITIRFNDHVYDITPEVLFAGEGNVDEVVDFKNTDIAVLSCKVTGDCFPKPLKIKRSESDLMVGRYAYVMGYPGKPGPRYEDFPILKKLFDYEFGVKRISPGEIDATIGDLDQDIHNHVFQHDCTTLGGNSGSPVIDFDETGLGVFGIHFAGAKRTANYAHSLAVFRDRLEGLGIDFTEGSSS